MADRRPLGHKNYGSIPHLIGSRKGPEDIGLHPGQHRICCEKPRDRHDRVIVLEKLDGSNVGVANIRGEIVALGRAGFVASSSPYEQHHMFAQWVKDRSSIFASVLEDGERFAGEWIAQAHGTRYRIVGEPIVIFDLISGKHDRLPFYDMRSRVERIGLTTPMVLSDSGPCSVDLAMEKLGEFGHHGALDMAEGAVWRVERLGRVDFLAKFVRHGKVDGCYLPEIAGGSATWNWQPGQDIAA